MFDPTNNTSKQINESEVYEEYWVSQEWVIVCVLDLSFGCLLWKSNRKCP